MAILAATIATTRAAEAGSLVVAASAGSVVVALLALQLALTDERALLAPLRAAKVAEIAGAVLFFVTTVRTPLGLEPARVILLRLTAAFFVTGDVLVLLGLLLVQPAATQPQRERSDLSGSEPTGAAAGTPRPPEGTVMATDLNVEELGDD